MDELKTSALGLTHCAWRGINTSHPNIRKIVIRFQWRASAQRRKKMKRTLISVIVISVITYSVFQLLVLPAIKADYNLSVVQELLILGAMAAAIIIWSSLTITISAYLPLELVIEYLRSAVKKKDLPPRPNFGLPKEIEEICSSYEKLFSFVLSQATELGTTEKHHKSQQNFVTTVSHRLRTPITGLRWALEELKRQKELPSKKDADDLVETATKSAQIISNVVEELLKSSKFESEHRVETRQNVEVESLIANVIDEVSLLARSKNIKIAVHNQSGAIPTIRGFKDQLHLSIQNILSNAIYYSPKGEIVNMNLNHDNSLIEIQVEDGGIGLTSEDRALMFSKFNRGSRAVLMNTDGSGMGLFISKNIIANHGGDIEARNNARGGSTFVIRLPIKGRGEFEAYMEQ